MEIKKKDYIFCSLFGAYIAAVLWITLFSRLGTERRSFLLPFHSYVEILKGNRQFLLENIGNVVLFIPLGVALKWVGIRDVKKAGLLASLLIEVLQFTFALGTFECDDLIHNTLGAVIGAWCVEKIGGGIRLGSQMRRAILLSMVLCSMVPFSYREVRHQKMVRLAAIYDREDGTKNLLVLNGKNGFAWDTDVYVEYLNDGGICVSGFSHGKTWKRIADLELDSGVYEASNLISCIENSVKLYVAPYDEDKGDYVLQCITPMQQVFFELTKKTKVRVYLSVESGIIGSTKLMPVIYKLG